MEMKSHINYYYDPIMLKRLFAHALFIDIEDNNQKIDIIREIIDPDRFSELGPGTNRVAFNGPDGYCHKIALDRRGIVDNFTEFRRSPGIEWCAPRVYECNGLIAITEKVELISKDDFIANKQNILDICAKLAEVFIFEDIGFAAKNFCNWGIRRNGDLVILDTGYMIPILGNEEALMCPVCGRPLRYNPLYTGFVCKNANCNTQFSFIDIYRRLTNKVEDELYKDVTGFELPDFDRLNDNLYNTAGGTFLKGGHISYERGMQLASEDGSQQSPLNLNSGTLRFEDIRDILGVAEDSVGI